MAYYLIQASYTPKAWQQVVGKPRNRVEAVRPVAQKLGGEIKGAWLAFGEYDVVSIVEMPNNVAAAAFSMAALSTGMLTHMKMTPLMTVEEEMTAMERAATRVVARDIVL